MSATSVVYDLIARDNASRNLRKVENSASSLERGFGRLGQAAKVAGVALAGAAAATATVSVKMAVDFQASMEKVHTMAGASTKDVNKLSQAVLKLGTYAEQSPKQLADSLYHLKSVGMDNVAAMKALRQASDLAAVGGNSLEDTTNALAGAWRSGIKGAGSFRGAVATLNAIVGAGNMKMEDLTAAMGTGFLPAARSFGLSLKNVGSALALMTDEGIPAEVAATRLRMSFSLMGAPSKTAEKQLKTIGLTGLQLANAMRSKGGLIAAIGLLKQHLADSGMTASKTAALLSHAFGGGRSSSAILTLINNFSVLKKKQDQINDSMGRFGQSVKAQWKTAQAQFRLLQSSLDVMAIKLGSRLLPAVVDFVRFLNNKALPAASHFSDWMGRMLPIGRMEKDFHRAEKLASDFFAGLSGKSQKNQVSLDPHHVRMVEQMLPANSTVQFGEKLRNSVSGALNKAMNLKGVNWGKLGNTIGTGLAKALGSLGKLTGTLGTTLVKMFAHIDWVGIGTAVGKTAIPFAIGFVNSLLDPLFSGTFWKKHWLDLLLAVASFIPLGKFAGILGKVFEHVPILKAFAPLLKGMDKLASLLWDGIKKVLGGMGKAFLTGFRSVSPDIGKGFEDVLKLFPTRLGVLALDLVQKGKDLLVKLGEGIIKAQLYPFEAFGKVLAKILDFFGSAPSWLVKAGGLIVRGLARGIAAAGHWIWDVFKTQRTEIADAWKEIEGVLSKLWGGLKDLLAGPLEAARKAMSKAWGLIRDLFNAEWTWIKTTFARLWNGATSVVMRPINAARDQLKSIFGSSGPVQGAFSTVWGWVKGSFAKVWGGVKAIFTKPITSAIFLVVAAFLAFSGNMINIAAKAFGWVPGIGPKLKRAASQFNNFKNQVNRSLDGIHDRQVHVVVMHPVRTKGGSFVNGGAGGHLMADGGLVHGPGGPRDDLIPKWLSNGEYVMPADKTRKHLGLLHAIRAGRMAAGGLVEKTLGLHSTERYAAGMAKVWNSALGKYVTRLQRQMAPAGGPGGSYNASAGVAQWAPVILQVLKMFGLGRNWLGAGEHRMAVESGGNPTAVNRWDINWQEGHPSVGLMQVIRGTFGEYAGPYRRRGPFMYGVSTDPLANIYAGVNYALHNYGVPFVGGSKGYDSGGWLKPGATVAVNKTGKPEAVLTHSQWEKLDKLYQYLAGRHGVSDAHARKLEQEELARLRKLHDSVVKAFHYIISNSFVQKIVGDPKHIASAFTTLSRTLDRLGDRKLKDIVRRTRSNLDDLAKAWVDTGTKLKAAQKVLANVTQAVSSTRSSFLSNADPIAAGMTTMGGIVGFMTQQATQGKQFASLISQLKKKGLNSATLQQLIQAGPSVLSTAMALNNSGSSGIAQVNSLQHQLGATGTALGNAAAQSMYGVGQRAAEGIVKGLQSHENALAKQMRKLARAMVRAIKHELGIRSPSRVFAELGGHIGAGLAMGIDGSRPGVNSSLRRLVQVPQTDGFDRLAAAMRGDSGRGVHVAEGGIVINMPTTATPEAAAEAAGGRIVAMLSAVGI